MRTKTLSARRIRHNILNIRQKFGQLPILCSSVWTPWRPKTREWKTRDGRKVILENPKLLPNSTFNKNIWHILPVPLSLKLSIWHFATNVVMLQFKIVIILITTFSQCSCYKSPQSVINAAYYFPGSYSASGITNWATQQTWLDCFIVSLV